MATNERAARMTVDLGSRSLLRQLKMAAVQNDMTIREVVVEAIEFWLNHQELVEDALAGEKAQRVVAESQGGLRSPFGSHGPSSGAR